MLVKIVTGEASTIFNNELLATLWRDFPDIKVETFNEDNYKEKKKAMMIKASCGTRFTPFVAVFNENKDLIKAFYSEVGECTVKDVIEYLGCQNC